MGQNSRPNKVRREMVQRYRLVRALHVHCFNLLDTPTPEFATEFYFAVGDVLEGRPIDESKLRHIDMQKVRDFMKEDR